MSDKEQQLKACIHYYCVSGLYKSMQNNALECIRLFPSDPKYRLYYGLSLIFEGRSNEAIREIDAISEHTDLRIACNLAMIYAHKKLNNSDTSVMVRLESSVRDERKSASDMSLYYAALVLLYIDKIDKSSEYCDKLLTRSPSFRLGRLLHGWIDLLRGSYATSNSYFSEAAKNGEIEGILGKSMAHYKSNSISKASQLLTDLITNHPSFLPAYFEKLKSSLAAKEWDQVIDLTGKLLHLDRHCIDAHRYWLLHSIVWNRQDDDLIVARFDDLSASFELREPKNASLYLETAQLFSRICENNLNIIRKTISLVDKASFIDPTYQVAACIELGHENLLVNRVKDARRQFEAAVNSDENNVDAQVGLLMCMYAEKPYSSDTLETLETLEELYKTQMTPELAYLSALTGESRGKSSRSVMEKLNSLTKSHLDKLGKVTSLSFYRELNPQLLMKVVGLYLQFIPLEPQTTSISIDESSVNATKLLDPLLNSCPVHKEALLLWAEIKYLTGHASSALSILDKYGETSSNDDRADDAKCHLLRGRILSHLGQMKASQAALGYAIASDFNIKNDFIFILVQVNICKYYKRYEEAISYLKPALDKLQEIENTSVNLTSKQIEYKINIHLSLASLHDLLDQSSESEKILNQLHDKFSATIHESAILMAKAASAESKGLLDQALMILRATGIENEAYFTISRQKMANIYLKYRKDRRLMISCYREILEHEDTKEAYLMMGDAYMSILEPEKAVETYEMCLKKNARDSVLIRKVGEALIRAHCYERAITYYKAAVKTAVTLSNESDDETLQFALKFDLAQLLFKMKRYNESRELINSALTRISDQDTKTLPLLTWQAKLMYVSACIEMKTRSEKENLITTLKNAYTLQSKVLKRSQIEKQDTTDDHRLILVKIGCQLAEVLNDYSRNSLEASKVYKELLNLDHRNVKVISALARLEIQMNQFDSAQNHLSLLIKYASKDDHESILTMTEMLIGKNDLEAAYNQLKQLLDQNASNLIVLAKFIEISRRIGRLPEVPGYLDRCKHLSDNNAKYHYCCGLYEWYSQDTSAAVRSFYRSRNDEVYGEKALMNLIEIYINPECELIGRAQSSLNNTVDSQIEQMMKTANIILQELVNRFGESPEHRILDLSIQLLKRNKKVYEQVIVSCNEILKEVPDLTSAIVLIATCQLLAKNESKAKVTLKRLSKVNLVEVRDKERAALLLAEIYTESNKLDNAKKQLDIAFSLNKSSVIGHELRGFILEKEGDYMQAAVHYAIAYEICNQRPPTLGYKLAFSLLKASKFTVAIEIARQVLNAFPEYDNIDDIIQRALQAIQNNRG